MNFRSHRQVLSVLEIYFLYCLILICNTLAYFSFKKKLHLRGKYRCIYFFDIIDSDMHLYNQKTAKNFKNWGVNSDFWFVVGSLFCQQDAKISLNKRDKSTFQMSICQTVPTAIFPPNLFFLKNQHNTKAPGVCVNCSWQCAVEVVFAIFYC